MKFPILVRRATVLFVCLVIVAFVSAVAHAEPILPSDGRAPTNSPAPVNSRYIPLIASYCVSIVGASLLGGWLPTIVRLTHNRMQIILSFVGGLMLGIGVFHMLTHAARQMQSPDQTAIWLMVGIVTMFFLLRMFHFHHHEPVEMLTASPAETPAENTTHSHDHDHDGGDHHHHGHHHGESVHRLSWVGIALGLAVHTLIDGVALGASVRADAAHTTQFGLFGFGTFLAIVLHKPLDAVSITSLMAASGWSSRWRNAVNAGFAAMCPLGAILFLLGIERLAVDQSIVVGATLAFSAGVFICISLSDLLPEMELHSHNRLQLTTALLAGIFLAWCLGFLEPGVHTGHGH